MVMRQKDLQLRWIVARGGEDLDSEMDRVGEIIELQSAVDDRGLERRRTGLGLLALTPVTLLLLAAGIVFGGYMWWFPALWTPIFGFGAYRWLRMVRADRRDIQRLRDLGFAPDTVEPSGGSF
jgi:hypothetical protein